MKMNVRSLLQKLGDVVTAALSSLGEQADRNLLGFSRAWRLIRLETSKLRYVYAVRKEVSRQSKLPGGFWRVRNPDFQTRVTPGLVEIPERDLTF